MRVSGIARGLLGLASLSVVALSAVTPAAADKDVKVILDWLIQGTHAPWILAKEKGYFKAEGINVTIDAGKGGTTTAINTASGAYQFGYVDMVTMINFNAPIRRARCRRSTSPSTRRRLRSSSPRPPASRRLPISPVARSAVGPATPDTTPSRSC